MKRLSNARPSNPAINEAGRKSRRRSATFARITCPANINIPSKAIAAVWEKRKRINNNCNVCTLAVR